MTPFNYISLASLLLFLDDLMTNRLVSVAKLLCGATHLTILRGRLEAMRKLPKALTTEPLADEMADADAEHDDTRRALFYMHKAIAIYPKTPPALKAIAAKAATITPDLQANLLAHEKEAALVKKQQPEIEAMRPELATVPMPDGATYADWHDTLIGAGEKLDQHGQARADVKAANVPAADALRGSSLRSAIVEDLNAFLDGAEREIRTWDAARREGEAPKLLDIFGYGLELETKAQDRVSRRQAERAAKKKAAEEEAKRKAEEEAKKPV